MRKQFIFLLCAAVVAAAAVAVFLVRGTGEPSGNTPEGRLDATIAEKEMTSAAPSVSPDADCTEAAPTSSVRRVNKRALGLRNPSDKTFFDDPDHPFSAEDKKIAAAVQTILDEAADALSKGNEDTPEYERAKALLLKAAADAAVSANPAVRSFAVEAYSWLGGAALAEVSPMMADADEDVAEAAIDAVELALEEQDNVQLRFEAAMAYMNTFSANEDALAMLSGISAASALELIDATGDSTLALDRAAANRQLVVNAVGELIASQNDLCSQQGLELYNDITGEEWIGAEEAAIWAQDPDSYEAPKTLD